MTSSSAEAHTAAPSADDGSAAASDALETRLLAIVAAARFHNVDLDRGDLRFPDGEAPVPAALVEWVRSAGLWAKGIRLNWRQLMRVEGSAPIVLLFKDGSAGLLTMVDPERKIAFLRDPRSAGGDGPIAVDELRLSQVWGGEAILIRVQRGATDENAPFTLGTLAKMVLQESKTLRDIIIASVVMTFLMAVPPLLVMVTVNEVLTHQAFATLRMVAVLLAITIFYDTMLAFARRKMILVVGARVDARLNLMVFRRLLGLPLDYFERTTAGYVIHAAMQVNKIRDFITGKLMTTALDLITLSLLLPLLFFLQPTLTWIIIGCAGIMAAVIMAFLHPLKVAIGRWITAETEKQQVIVETLHGIRTVKSLALEPQQRELWDVKVEASTRRKLEAGTLANWPQSIVHPIELFMSRGVILLGAYLAVKGDTGVDAGTLMAFMMLSMRVAGPLASIARLMEDVEETRGAISIAGQVLNNAPESTNPSAGLRPKFEGAVTFHNVVYSYPRTKTRALDGISFQIPAGTMLGLVGRSGSGKSTVTRLLQGITRDYEGFVKLDNVDLREINLGHMRRSFGVVLQENFLFRGSIRENILAGRPGLTLTDAVRAARLAGAEEFIERMPQGFETWIEEGSPNLSGGQRQRLAIARALIHDPRLLILDEATSALDPESEALVNANLARIAKGRTMFIVSHRLSSLTDCDQILVLDKGAMVDMAPHRELVERCAIYRTLWLQQNRHLEGQGPRPGSPTPVLAQGDD